MKSERIGEFEELILLAIRMHREDASGVGIQEALKQKADRSVSLGAIYSALDRLARKGCVESWLGDPTPVRGGRAKRYFALTPKGEKELAEGHRLRDSMWSQPATFEADGGGR